MHWLHGHLLKQFSKGKKHALDIGCDRRVWRQFYVCDYIGLDIYKSVRPDIVAEGSLLPFRDDTFDLVTAFSSLEFVQSYERAFQEIRRVLKKDGLFIIIGMNPRAIRNLLKQEPDRVFNHRFDMFNLPLRLLKNGLFPITIFHPIDFALTIYYDLTSVYTYAIAKPIK